MLKKMSKMLKQQEGFTLMELMIVVVIIGILGAIAIPVYNGVQDRARLAVGEANAAMLNRGAKQLSALGYSEGDGENAIDFPAETPYDNSAAHVAALRAFLTLGDEDVQYVTWSEEKGFEAVHTATAKWTETTSTP